MPELNSKRRCASSGCRPFRCRHVHAGVYQRFQHSGRGNPGESKSRNRNGILPHNGASQNRRCSASSFRSCRLPGGPGDGSQYRGNVGRQPGYEQHHSGFPRHSGSGEYAGCFGNPGCLWALAYSFVAGSKTYTLKERKLIWFWGVMALISVLFAFGRYAGFYQFIYKLPYFSNIRNPIKFMHPFHLSVY